MSRYTGRKVKKSMSRYIERKVKKLNKIATASDGMLAEDMIVYKKAVYKHGYTWKHCIIKLLIPKNAKVCNRGTNNKAFEVYDAIYVTEKCRADKAKVLDIQDMSGKHLKFAYSMYERFSKKAKKLIRTRYWVGCMVYPDSYDANPWNTCSNGIHFFVTREEAKQY